MFSALGEEAAAPFTRGCVDTTTRRLRGQPPEITGMYDDGRSHADWTAATTDMQVVRRRTGQMAATTVESIYVRRRLPKALVATGLTLRARGAALRDESGVAGLVRGYAILIYYHMSHPSQRAVHTQGLRTCNLRGCDFITTKVKAVTTATCRTANIA